MTPPSVIAYRGGSLLDGETRVVVLLTGLHGNSDNRKTGRVVQAHILVDERRPADAARDGTDAAICGDCPRRRTPERGTTCYVSLAMGYPQIGEKLIANEYPRVSGAEAAEFVAGSFVRIGAYGDPAAVPVGFWMQLAGRSSAWTAYTHQWRVAPELRPIAMASVESESERAQARMAGWRTFRVRGAEPVEALAVGEMMCPASVEGGKRQECATCRMCSGLASPGRDVAIIDHSVKARWARGIGPRKRLQIVQPERRRDGREDHRGPGRAGGMT